jgi:hypothetical protein
VFSVRSVRLLYNRVVTEQLQSTVVNSNNRVMTTKKSASLVRVSMKTETRSD